MIKVAIWLKYGAEVSLNEPMGGIEAASLKIARLLGSKAEVSVYCRGQGEEKISENAVLYGISSDSEVDYIQRGMEAVRGHDILHCMAHTYFYFFDVKEAKTLLNLRTRNLPLLWVAHRRKPTGEHVYAPAEESFIRERLDNILRWGGAGFPGVDGIAACSRFIAKSYSSRFPGRSIDVIYNPVEVSGKINAKRGDYILFVGVFAPEKGVDTLIKTAGLLNEKGVETPIYVIGSSTLWGFDTDDSFRESFSEHENIVLLGPKTPGEALEYMAKAKAGFIPSRFDALPNVALEFQACGTPIVASNAGGIPEAVVDGKTGFLSGPDDPEAFAENITRLLSNPSLRVRMGKAGVAHVKKSFSPEKCLQEYMHLYGRMLK